jgi:hypothetical protein
MLDPWILSLATKLNWPFPAGNNIGASKILDDISELYRWVITIACPSCLRGFIDCLFHSFRLSRCSSSQNFQTFPDHFLPNVRQHSAQPPHFERSTIKYDIHPRPNPLSQPFHSSKPASSGLTCRTRYVEQQCSC